MQRPEVAVCLACSVNSPVRLVRPVSTGEHSRETGGGPRTRLCDALESLHLCSNGKGLEGGEQGID